MNRNYLIPANSKKSIMIFGIFYTFDLVLLGCGVGLTLILFLVLPIEEVLFAMLSILPASITGLLVFPIPNYHNVLTVIIEAWIFLTTRQKYMWKGWCVLDGENQKK